MSFPMEALGEVLTKSDEWIDLYPNEQYRQVKVRLWGKGVMLREEVSGAQIAASKQLVVHSQQFIVSRIDARNGAFGLIPDSLDGAVVSSDFPVFTVNPSRILPKYLNWMSKTHFFIDLCKAASEGTTNRVRLKEDRFLVAKIPLPPLAEQRRIVARIEELAAKIEEARGLRKKAGEEVEALLELARVKIFSKASTNGWKSKKIDEVAPINMGQSPPGHSYNDIEEGIPLLNGPTEFGEHYPNAVQWTTSPTKLCKKDDILLCVRGATTGRMNWADKEYCIGRGLAALTANPEICLSEYVYQFVETQTLQMLALSAGSTFPNLPGAKLKSLDIPIPPLPEQRRIVAYLDELQAKVDALRRLQAETGAELDALIPAVLDKAFKGEM